MASAVSLDSGVLTLSSMEKELLDLDEHIKSTKEAQSALNGNASYLAQFLQELNETEVAYDLQPYTGKLRDVSRRVKSVEEILNDAHDRLSALQRQIAREIFKQKKQITSASGDVVVPEPPTH